MTNDPKSGSAQACSSPQEADNRICFCHGVSEAQIREAIEKGADTLEKIQQATAASTGCGGCQEEVEQILATCLKIHAKK